MVWLQHLGYRQINRRLNEAKRNSKKCVGHISFQTSNYVCVQSKNDMQPHIFGTPCIIIFRSRVVLLKAVVEWKPNQ